jgi:undecaprenyl-diphosphatase
MVWTKTKAILLLVIITGIFLSLLLILGNGNLMAGDSALFYLLNPHALTPYDEFFLLLTNWGPGEFGLGFYLLIALLLVLVVLSLKYNSLRPARFMLLLVVAGILIGWLGITQFGLKILINRPRPFMDVAMNSNALLLFTPSELAEIFWDTSFPSGHAASAFIFVTPFLLLFKKYWIRALALAYGILLGYARIFIGVHYPIDVFVGSCIGILVVAGLYILFKRYLLPKWSWFQLEEPTTEKKP